MKCGGMADVSSDKERRKREEVSVNKWVTNNITKMM